MIALSCGIKISAVHCLVLLQLTKHACDGQTDGQNYDSQDLASIAASRGINVNTVIQKQLEKVAIIAMYCHLRPPNVVAFPTIRFLGFESELQSNAMPFHLQSMWGATLMPVRGCAMD